MPWIAYSSLDRIAIDPEIQRPGKYLTGDFKNDPFVLGGAVVHGTCRCRLLLCHCLTQMVSREPTDLNIFSEPRDSIVDNIADLFVGILDKCLL